jgi:toxin CcdB
LAGVMPRSDVHRCRRAGVPYLVDNQTDLSGRLPTRLVIPRLPATAFASLIERLHLRVAVEGRELVLATNLMASVRRDQLGDKVASLEDRRGEIIAAVDFLQQGF